MPNLRAAALRQSATEVGVEGLAAVATSTTTQTTLAGLAFNGLDAIAATGRGLLLDAQKGFAFVVDCTQAKEFALAWTGGATMEDASLNRPMTVRLGDAVAFA